MGILRDERASIGLTNEQKLKFYRGYYPINAAKGTKLYNRYNEARRKLYSIINVILNFHDAINNYNIKRQLNSSPLNELEEGHAIKLRIKFIRNLIKSKVDQSIVGVKRGSAVLIKEEGIKIIQLPYPITFRYKHPCYLEWIKGLKHFKNHAALMHGVWHLIKRHH
ncbi:hypothetical protein V2W45_1464745 [Cenococcum geophilum]